MKQIKIFTNGIILKTITNFSYSSIKENSINKISGIKTTDPTFFLEKQVEIWNFNIKIFVGIIKKIDYNKNTGLVGLEIYPIVIDLIDYYIEKPTGTEIEKKEFSYNGSVEGLITEIITQYRTKATTPLLEIGNLAVSNIVINANFFYHNLHEVYLFIIKEILKNNLFIRININGTVDLLNSENTIFNLKYGTDIKQINYTESTIDNVKNIIFSNKNNIKKFYTNNNVNTGKSIFLENDLIIDEITADNYINNYFEKHTNNIIIKDIITTEDIPLYSQINIYNWEKFFTNQYVYGKEYLTTGEETGTKKEIKIKLLIGQKKELII